MANAKPFKLTSPTDPGVKRDPSTGRLVSAEQVQPLAPPVLVAESGKGVEVQTLIARNRAATGSTDLPTPPMVPPSKPMRVS